MIFQLPSFFFTSNFINTVSHYKGLILDHVLSYVSCVGDGNVINFAILDHKSLVFQVSLISPVAKACTMIFSQPQNSLSVPHVCQAFNVSNTFFAQVKISASVQSSFSCITVYSIAPVRYKISKYSLLQSLFILSMHTQRSKEFFFFRSESVSKYSNNPRILFKTIKPVIGPQLSQPVESHQRIVKDFFIISTTGQWDSAAL